VLLLLQAICIVQLICIAMNCASRAGALQQHDAPLADSSPAGLPDSFNKALAFTAVSQARQSSEQRTVSYKDCGGGALVGRLQFT